MSSHCFTQQTYKTQPRRTPCRNPSYVIRSNRFLAVLVTTTLLAIAAAKPLPPLQHRQNHTLTFVPQSGLVGPNPSLSPEFSLGTETLPSQKLPRHPATHLLSRIVAAFRQVSSSSSSAPVLIEDTLLSASPQGEDEGESTTATPVEQSADPEPSVEPELLLGPGTPHSFQLPDHYEYDPYGYAGSVKPSPSVGSSLSTSATTAPSSGGDQFSQPMPMSMPMPIPPPSASGTSSGSISASRDRSTPLPTTTAGPTAAIEDNPYGYDIYVYDTTASPSMSQGSSLIPSPTAFPSVEEYTYAVGRLPPPEPLMSISAASSPFDDTVASPTPSPIPALASASASVSASVTVMESAVVSLPATPAPRSQNVLPSPLPSFIALENAYSYDNNYDYDSSPSASTSLGSSPSASLTPFPSHNGYLYDGNYSYDDSNLNVDENRNSESDTAASNATITTTTTTTATTTMTTTTSSMTAAQTKTTSTSLTGDNSVALVDARSDQYSYDGSAAPSPLPTLTPLPSFNPSLYSDYEYDSRSEVADVTAVASMSPFPSMSRVAPASPSAPMSASVSASVSPSPSASVTLSSSPSISPLPLGTAREGESCSVFLGEDTTTRKDSTHGEGDGCAPGLVCEVHVLSRDVVMPGTCRVKPEQRRVCRLDSCTDGGAGAPCEAHVDGSKHVMATTCGVWAQSKVAPDCANILCATGCDGSGVVDNLGVGYCNRCLLELRSCVSGFSVYARA